MDRNQFLEFKKSTLSGNNGCVEIAMTSDKVHVRDSKDPQSPMLTFDMIEWRAFLGGVRNQEFNVST